MGQQSTIVTLLFIYQLSIGASCPPECICDEIRLSVKCHSQEIPRLIPPSTKRLTLDGLNIEYIPKFAFSGLRNLIYLSIEGDTIRELLNDTFFGLSSLETLNMMYTLTAIIHPDTFSHLPSIRYISLTHNQEIGLKTFGDSLYSLRNSSTIRQLNLTGISRSEYVLEPSFFRHFLRTKIKTIILSMNNLAVIRAGFSRYIPHIETLVLSNNFIVGEISALVECVFLTKLRFLDMSHQRKDRNHKRSLDLKTKAPLQFIPRKGNVTALTPNVCKNKPIIYIPPRLEFLYFQQIARDISHISKGCVHSRNNLKVLDISGSYIEYIAGQVVGLEHLEVFKIRYCQCSNIPLDFFQYFPGLQILDLGFNRLSAFIHGDNGSLLGNNHRLTSLDISLNGLESLPTRFLKSISHINVLHAAQNTLKSLSEFGELKNLTILNVTNNAISNLGQIDFDSLYRLSANCPNMTLYLSGNPITTVSRCCEIYQFIIWTKRNEAHIGDISNYTCLLNSRFIHFIELSESTLKQQCGIVFADQSVILDSSTLVILILLIVAASLSYRYRWKFRWLALMSKRILHRNQEIDDPTQYVFDAFISFNVDDIKWVKDNLIVELEEKRGLRLCIHHRDFPPSRSIEENIVDAIEISRKTILVLSSNFVKSNWCHFEVQMARNKLFEKGYDVIVPILLGDFDLNLSSRTLKNILTSNTYLKWEADINDNLSREPFWNMLYDALKDRSKNSLRQ